MNISLERTVVIMCILMVMQMVSGCQRPPEGRKKLPEKPPKIKTLEFTGPQQGWPPQPTNRINVKLVPWQEIPGSLTDSLETQIRQAALQDARVRTLLGERYAWISTDTTEPDKEQTRSSSAPLATRVTFFSHTNNMAVVAQMTGLKIESVSKAEGYQPPEGPDEIKTAVALAYEEQRLQGKLDGLTAEAILAFPDRKQPGFGHRVLYVAFSKEEEDQTRFYALVDLTDRKIINAGPAAGMEKE